MESVFSYVNDRLLPQTEWYDKRSQRNRKSYLCCAVIRLVLGGSIPLLAAVTPLTRLDSAQVLLAAGVLGLLVVVADRIESLYDFHENWLRYRATAEALRHEYYLWKAECEPYDGDDRDLLLARNAEATISRESAVWLRSMRKSKMKSGDASGTR